jgi:Uncharacterized protein conserved in bacteria (DUF2239)
VLSSKSRGLLAVPTRQSLSTMANFIRVLLTYKFNPGIIPTSIQFKTDFTVTDTATPSYTSFNGHMRIASGSLPVNALAVKHALASGVPSPLLTFCDQTGQVVEIDIRGSDAEMLARLPPEGYQLQRNESALINSGDLVSHVVVAGQSLGLSHEKSRYCRATGIGWLHSQMVRP